jgi:hypothetical protein
MSGSSAIRRGLQPVRSRSSQIRAASSAGTCAGDRPGRLERSARHASDAWSAKVASRQRRTHSLSAGPDLQPHTVRNVPGHVTEVLGAAPVGGYHRDMSVKQRFHDAIDAMTEPEATAALQSLADASGAPVGWMLDHAPSEAPVDDEVESLSLFDIEHATGPSTVSADELKQSLGIE